jgi:uncharacterized short protein YbdD (DUF466 family)
MTATHPDIPVVGAYVAQIKRDHPDLPPKMVMLLERAFIDGYRQASADTLSM